MMPFCKTGSKKKEQVEREDNFNLYYIEFELPIHIQIIQWTIDMHKPGA
jgi:hypothetical protein